LQVHHRCYPTHAIIIDEEHTHNKI
jgi:hypothetical protein